MDLNVFACQGGFLLSAECMLAPKRATDAYWPVSALLGVVNCRELPQELCNRILADIDSQHFSFVGTPEAVLVGLPMLASLRPYGETALHPGGLK